MTLELRFLGEMEVAQNGELLSLPPSRKTRALLAYLVLSGRPLRREHLVSMFWNIPDDPRGALRWSLSKLRTLVDERDRRRIVATGDNVSFDTSSAEIDVLAVRKAVARPGIKALSTECLTTQEAAFRGGLLDGLDLPDCRDFEAWRAAEREDARRLHAEILRELIDRSRSNAEAALAYARKLARVDPFEPNGHAILSQYLLATGRRDEAARQREWSARSLKEISNEALRAFEAALSQAALSSRASQDTGSVSVNSPDAWPICQTDHASDPNDIENLSIEQDIRFCEASDGVQLAYATVGEGPPIVKAPTWLTHLEYEWQSPVWRHVLLELSRQNTLVRYDERGNGLSDWDVEEISFEASVRDLETVVDALGLERFALFGVSQGCATSIAYAARNPDRVTRLILIGGYARGWRKRATGDKLEQGKALLTLIRHGWGQENPAFRQVYTSLFIPNGTPEQAQWFNDLQKITASPEIAARIRESRGEIDVRPLLPEISAPTIVFHALNDALVPFAEGRHLAMKIRNARFVPLDSSNHLILEHEPAWPRFVYELRRFLTASPAEASPNSE